jgi:cytochrome c553
MQCMTRPTVADLPDVVLSILPFERFQQRACAGARVVRIAGQREDYLVKALRDYKSGVRAGGGMAAMADVAYPLSEEEIVALAHYLAHL